MDLNPKWADTNRERREKVFLRFRIHMNVDDEIPVFHSSIDEKFDAWFAAVAQMERVSGDAVTDTSSP